MVALRKLTDADKGVDWMARFFVGLVKADVEPKFQIRRSGEIKAPGVRPALVLEEKIAADQFGNLCVGFAAHLFDGELWAWGAWVGYEKWTESGKSLVLVKSWKKFRVFDDAMMDALRARAFTMIAEANLAILKARHAAKQTAIPANVASNPSAA